MTPRSQITAAEASPIAVSQPHLPGALSQTLLETQALRESNARAYPRHLPVAIAHGDGAYVRDVDGRVYIDFLCGAGALPLGHGHSRLVAAVHRQLDQLTQGLDFPTPAKMEFMDLLLSMLPEAMQERTRIHFCGPAGADAVDAAIKLCKTATGRGDVVCFHGGFHGSTQSTIAMTGLRAPKEHLVNLLPGVNFFPYSYCYRCPLSLQRQSCAINCAAYLENILRDPNGGVRRPAAAIVEVIQGEGGVVPARIEFVQELRRITREHDIPLIVDEIQSGCGRTGRWFAFEHFNIEPDVIVSSKALGGLGLPIAIILYDQRLDKWAPGAHTGTFRGHQLAFAGGAEFIRVVREERLLEHAARQGARFHARLDEVARRYELLGDVRGIGLMLGVEIVDPRDGRPDPAAARRIQAQCLAEGLILELGGRDDTVVRFLPPINIDDATMDAGLLIFQRACEATAHAQMPG
jgi:diaminobutyrate-2-oxoglutarate transaminase